MDILSQEYRLSDIVSKGIHALKDVDEGEKELIIDDVLINSDGEFEDILKNKYDCQIFNENSKVHLKLRLNLREYLIITNVLYPTLIRWNSK